MNDYIKEMMKMAGVEPQYKKRIECKDGFKIGDPCNNQPCIFCDKAVFEGVFPMFTPKKREKIIRYILSHKYLKLSMEKDTDGGYCFIVETINKDFISRCINISQTLAKITTDLMNVGKLSKKKVKEILEK